MSIPDHWPPHVRRRATAFLALWKYYRYSRTLSEVAVPYMQLKAQQVSQSRDDVLRASALLSYWLASLYVLAEGWLELKLTDPRIDSLLTEEHLNTLRRYRNAVFHYQRNINDPRLSDILNDVTMKWIFDLGSAFQDTFDHHADAIDAEAIRGWLFAPAE